jgi:hypothetical protein
MAVAAPESARLKSEMDPSGSGYGRTVAQNRPLRRECLGSDATWAKEPSLLAAARLALALGGPEERWNRPKKAGSDAAPGG